MVGAAAGMSGALCVRAGGSKPPNPPGSVRATSNTRARTGAPGWVRPVKHRPDCPVSGSTPLCMYCIRSGFDLRLLFCPW